MWESWIAWIEGTSVQIDFVSSSWHPRGILGLDPIFMLIF